MSARLRAGAGAVLRREGLVRALDLAARGPLGHPGAVLGFVAVLVPRRGILAPVGLCRAHGDRVGMFANAEERPHDEKCPYKIIFGDDDSGECYTSLDKCSARVVGKPAEKVCCFAERIIEPTLDMCDPNNTHSVYQCPNSKYNSTFFENMGYRGQSCEDERMLWEFIDQPFTEGWMGVC